MILGKIDTDGYGFDEDNIAKALTYTNNPEVIELIKGKEQQGFITPMKAATVATIPVTVFAYYLWPESLPAVMSLSINLNALQVAAFHSIRMKYLRGNREQYVKISCGPAN